MVKSGSLKIKRLVDLLRELREEKVTGTIDIKSYYGVGSIYLIDGKVIMASSSQSTERIGRRVVESGLLTEVQLQQALKQQKEDKERKHLGEILVKLGLIDNIDLEKLIHIQIKEIIYGMNFWKDGFFRFDHNLAENIPSNILLDPNTFADDEIEKFLKEHGAVTQRAGLKKHIEETESIKGEITKRIDDLSEKLRSFRQKDLVFLVEDEMLMRQIITDKLSEFGFEVQAVSTPKEALEKMAYYEANGISPIVLTDLVMPSISGKGMFGGMELLEKLQEEYPHIPVIMTTAYPDPNTKQKALFWGVYYYIAKPDRTKVKPEELDSLFDNYIEEISLSIENIIRRREVYLEKDHLDIIRNELVGELFSTKLELSEVEKTMETKVDELGFLKKTSDTLIKDQNVNDVSENILNYASKDLDRVVIMLAKKGGFFAFKGIDTQQGGKREEFNSRLKNLTIKPEDIDILNSVVKEKKGYEGRVDPTLLPMIKRMGDDIPEKVVILPMIVEGRVVGILYGDTMPGSPPCRSADAIMILLNLASLSLEISHLRNIVKKASER